MPDRPNPAMTGVTVISDDSDYLQRLTHCFGESSSIWLSLVRNNNLTKIVTSVTKTEVALLDIGNRSRPEMEFILDKLSAHTLQPKIIITGDSLTEHTLAQVIPQNVYGVLPKDIEVETYLKAFFFVSIGEIWLNRKASTSLLKYLADQQPAVQNKTVYHIGSTLTEREKEIAALVARGLSNKEIAKLFSLSPVTVKTHLRNIFEKLHIARRSEVILKSESLHDVSGDP